MIRVLRGDDASIYEYGPAIKLKIMVDGEAGAANVSAGWISFDPGAKTDDHVRSVEETIFVIRGETVITSDGQEYRLSPGDAIFIPPGTTHRHENRGSEVLEQMWIFAPQGPEKKMRELPSA